MCYEADFWTVASSSGKKHTFIQNLHRFGPQKTGVPPYRLNQPILHNKAQYVWFPGKSQNSKKFSAKIKQNPTMSKNHRVFLNIFGG